MNRVITTYNLMNRVYVYNINLMNSSIVYNIHNLMNRVSLQHYMNRVYVYTVHITYEQGIRSLT